MLVRLCCKSTVCWAESSHALISIWQNKSWDDINLLNIKDFATLKLNAQLQCNCLIICCFDFYFDILLAFLLCMLRQRKSDNYVQYNTDAALPLKSLYVSIGFLKDICITVMTLPWFDRYFNLWIGQKQIFLFGYFIYKQFHNWLSRKCII